MKFTLNVPTKMSKTAEKAATDLDRWMKSLNVLIDRLTPENTWEMLKHNTRVPSVIEWNRITARIYNDVKSKSWFLYWKAVETWVQNTKYAYQKPKWNKLWFVWVWVHTYKRALNAMKPVILQFLKR